MQKIIFSFLVLIALSVAVTARVKCVDCAAVEPQCNCKEGQRCDLVPQTCEQCARAVCKDEDQCVKCPMIFPECNCGDMECEFIDSCSKCPQIRCVPRDSSKKCVECPADAPVCDCAEDEECHATDQTCDQCRVPVCKAKPKEDDCVFCPEVVLTCSNCSKDQECMVTKQSCKKCAEAVCVRRGTINKSCVVCALTTPKCECSPETCEIVAQTCDRCAYAKCPPTDGKRRSSKRTGRRLN